MLILTVCRSGGDFRREHADRLRDQCAKYASGVPFRTLFDEDLEHCWKGWWSKIELFKTKGPVLYMDLDTSIVGDLTPLLDVVEDHDFIALHDFNRHFNRMGSGLMAWRGDQSHIYREFLKCPHCNMMRCRTRLRWGDQGFIEPLTKGRAHWQDILPGMVVSWKKHCKSGVPKGARVVCFHGKPRPWDIE